MEWGGAYELCVHEASADGIFTEFLLDRGGTTVAIVAPHGGAVEPHTGVQAQQLAHYFDNAVCWGTQGYVDGGYNCAFDRWHYTVEDLAVEDFPLFSEIASREFDHAIAFHAMGGEGIIVGGRAPRDKKQHVAESLRERVSAEITVVSDGSRAGMNPENFVNTVAPQGGIHLEQGIECAADASEQVVEGVRDALNRLL